MSCCRENPSADVVLYQQVDAVARAIAANPEKFKEDLQHYVKGPKLLALKAALDKV